MSIRADLKEVESLISRLILIGEEYHEKDRLWVHFKNNEDWESCVYPIDDRLKKGEIERIYSYGRTMGGEMSSALGSINYDFTTYPTLTKIIEKINPIWGYNDSETLLQDAINAHDSLGLNCFAFDEMIFIYREQIELANGVMQTLNLLRESRLYKGENGLPIKEEENNISFGNISNSNVAFSSKNTEQSVVIKGSIFDEILDAIQSSDIEHKKSLITATKEMKIKYESGDFRESYNKFISVAANHMTLFVPFIPALSALL